MSYCKVVFNLQVPGDDACIIEASRFFGLHYTQQIRRKSNTGTLSGRLGEGGWAGSMLEQQARGDFAAVNVTGAAHTIDRGY